MNLKNHLYLYNNFYNEVNHQYLINNPNYKPFYYIFSIYHISPISPIFSIFSILIHKYNNK